MGYPDDATEWLPKWRDLDLIEHRRHGEAVEAAVAGLDEGDDIVLIGGALAGTSTARRAIANAWAPGVTLEWYGPFAAAGEWLDEQDVWSALLSEARTRGDIAWTDHSRCWKLCEREVGSRPHDAGRYVAGEIAKAGVRLVTIEGGDRWQRNEPELAFAEHVETVTNELDAAGVRTVVCLEGSILDRSNAALRCPRGTRVVYVAAYGRGVDMRGLTEGPGGPDRESEAREAARICEAMHTTTGRPLAQPFTPAQHKTLLDESHGNAGTLIEWTGCAIAWARGRPVTWSDYGLGGSEDWKRDARERCIEGAEGTALMLCATERRPRRAPTADATNFDALMRELQSKGNE